MGNNKRADWGKNIENIRPTIPHPTPQLGHEEFHWHHTLQSFHRAAWGCVLSRGHIPFIQMVHKKGPKISPDRRMYIYFNLSQELAFRSAFLYAGLLISNAFGSVSDFFSSDSMPCFSSEKSWWQLVFLVTWRENAVYGPGDGRFPQCPVDRSIAYMVSQAILHRGIWQQNLRLKLSNSDGNFPGSHHNIRWVQHHVRRLINLLVRGLNVTVPTVQIGGYYLIMWVYVTLSINMLNNIGLRLWIL